jgi:hypothetical protein
MDYSCYKIIDEEANGFRIFSLRWAWWGRMKHLTTFYLKKLIGASPDYCCRTPGILHSRRSPKSSGMIQTSRRISGI